MRVAVTGAAGFIGSSLVDRLLEEGHEVVGVDNFDDYYSGKMRFLRPHLERDDFALERVDILDRVELGRALEGCDPIFHLAAQAGVRASVQDPMKSHRVNVEGTLNVLQAARDLGANRVINSSSSSVYGEAKRLPVEEEDRLSPVSPYATSKMSAELYCDLFHRLYGLETISLRYFTVYGPRQRPDMAIRIFVDQVLRGERPGIFGDGEQTRDFTYIGDVVDAILLAGKRGVTGPLNICGGSNVSINRLVSMILRILGREDLRPRYLPAQAGDVSHTWGDNTRARRSLGWSPEVHLEKGLRAFVDWYA
ncbi:MAG: GDP-mannose 4,6-dehydratase [Methanomassiliicoccales archaeon]